MRTFLLKVALPAVLAITLDLQVAHADIFTWTDASGRINVSNLDPPAGVHVTSVLREKPVKPSDAVRREDLRHAEVMALEERVRQLQDDVEAARQQAVQQQVAPRVVYNAVTLPPAPSYAPQMVYSYVEPPAVQYGCDPSWAGCSSPQAFLTTTVVVRNPRLHRFRFRGGHRRASPPFVPSHSGGRTR